MTNKTIEAIQRAKAYVHYKRLEKDQSEDNQCMANDLALILEALQAAQTMPSREEYAEWIGLGIMQNTPRSAAEIYNWLRDNSLCIDSSSELASKHSSSAPKAEEASCVCGHSKYHHTCEGCCRVCNCEDYLKAEEARVPSEEEFTLAFDKYLQKNPNPSAWGIATWYHGLIKSNTERPSCEYEAGKDKTCVHCGSAALERK